MDTSCFILYLKICTRIKHKFLIKEGHRIRNSSRSCLKQIWARPTHWVKIPFPPRISDVPWFKVRVPYSSHSELSACHHRNENMETIDVFHKNYITVLPNHEGFPDCKSWYYFKHTSRLLFAYFGFITIFG